MKATLQIKITSGLLLTHKVATFPWGFVPLLMLLGLKAKSLALNSSRLGLATVPSTLIKETNNGGNTGIEDVFSLAPWGRGIMEGSSTPKSAFSLNSGLEVCMTQKSWSRRCPLHLLPIIASALVLQGCLLGCWSVTLLHVEGASSASQVIVPI